MKTPTLIFALLATAAVAAAAPVSERWAAAGEPATHPGTLNVVKAADGLRLQFDLSAIPKGATVHHASLYCFTAGDAQPAAPAVLKAAGGVLKLEPAWFRSFDATAAVAKWVADPAANDGFLVERFDGLQADRSYLQVLFDGTPAAVPPQVAGVHAVHHDGQTFVVWTEAASYRPQADEVRWVETWDERGDTFADGPGVGADGLGRVPTISLRTLRRLQGLGLRDQPSGFQGIKPLRRVREVEPIVYRVYRHTAPITAANIAAAELLAEVDPLDGWDQVLFATDFKGEYIDQREVPDSPIPTFCVADGKPIAAGECLYVHSPAGGQRAYYAVTMMRAGTENVSQIGPANSLAEAVLEQPGRAKPVLQFLQEDQYKRDVTERWYRYWAGPPYYHLPVRGFRVGVGVPKKIDAPLELHLNSISGDFNLRGLLVKMPSAKAITLTIESIIGYAPVLCYNSGRGTLLAATQGKVDYFSERFMLNLLQWALANWQIDRRQITGGMMYFGMRHPEIYSRLSFGTYTATYDFRWAPGSSSLSSWLGPRGIKTVDGDDAWDMFSVGGYLRKYPARDIPFMACISGTGKDSGHTSEFGWQDDPRGWRALLDARQTFVAAWSCGLPPELTAAFNTMRWDVSLPAFSNCSLDNNPGNGDPTDGDYYGQINAWLLWSDTEQADEPARWEMTVRVLASCPEDRCTVDVTPRHCRAFKPKPGERFQWTNTSAATGKVIQSGTATADQWGLVTLPGVQVDKGRNRLKIERR